LSSVAQRRYHCPASHIEIVRITIELEGGSEDTTKVHARVPVPDVGKNRRKSGNNCFLGNKCKDPNVIRKLINYTKQIFGSPRPGLFEWAENV
jgi:hypothetical protein